MVPVYISTGSEVYHLDHRCDAMETGSERGISWCTAGSAHFSRLRACGTCAGSLEREMNVSLGSVPSGEKHGRGMPKLISFAPVGSADDVLDADDWVELPYGSPKNLDDARFENKSKLDFGAAAYRQDPEEFLGSDTDDDNDWRGQGRRLD